MTRRAEQGGQTRACASTCARPAASSSPSTYGVTKGSSFLQSDMALRCDQRPEGFEQHPAAARDARHHRAGWNLQHVGDLGVRKLLHVAQPDGLTEGIRQRVDRGLEVRIEG